MDDSWIRRQDQQSPGPAEPGHESRVPRYPGQTERGGDGCTGADAGDGDAACERHVLELLANLEAVLRAEHQVLVEAAAGALTTLARQKMALLASIEQSCQELGMARGRAWLEEDRAAIEVLARCRGLNHINGNLIALRRRQVAQELAVLGVSLPETEPAEALLAMPGPGADQHGSVHASAHGASGWTAAAAIPTEHDPQGEAVPRRNIQHLA